MQQVVDVLPLAVRVCSAGAPCGAQPLPSASMSVCTQLWMLIPGLCIGLKPHPDDLHAFQLSAALLLVRCPGLLGDSQWAEPGLPLPLQPRCAVLVLQWC